MVQELELQEIIPGVCDRIFERSSVFASLGDLVKFLRICFLAEGQSIVKSGGCRGNFLRCPSFHSLQIGLDLWSSGICSCTSVTTCPLAVGSSQGLRKIRQYSQIHETVESLSQKIGRTPAEIQTSLCCYNKYCKWLLGQATN